MHPINEHIVKCALRRDQAMRAARDYPSESHIFVRFARDWNRSMLRQIAAERDSRKLECDPRAPRPKDYGG